MTREQCEQLKAGAPEPATGHQYAEVGVGWDGSFNFTIDGSWTAEQARDELLPWIQYWVAQATSRETTGSG